MQQRMVVSTWLVAVSTRCILALCLDSILSLSRYDYGYIMVIIIIIIIKSCLIATLF